MPVNRLCFCIFINTLFFLCCIAETQPIILSELALAPNYLGTQVSIIRSNTSELPESINREAYAAIDRARNALVQIQNKDGTWTTDENRKTVLPALALIDGTNPSIFYTNEFCNAISAAKK